MLLGVVAERTVADLQEIGGLGADSFRSFQGSLQIPSLRFRNLFFKVKPFGWKGGFAGGPRPGGQSWGIASYAVGQDTERDLPAGLQRNGALHSVLELTNVSRPVVGLQTANHFRRQCLNGLFHRLTEPFEEMPCQEGYILAALPQCGDLDGNNAQAVVQVFAEAAFCNLFFKFLVGGGDNADIYVDFFGAADGPDFAFLEDAIEFHLHGQAHVANFVHKERAAMGSLEQPLAILVGARESAFHIAEEFRFQESLRKGTAIDGDKGRLGTEAVFVNGARNQFFSRTAFASD